MKDDVHRGDVLRALLDLSPDIQRFRELRWLPETHLQHAPPSDHTELERLGNAIAARERDAFTHDEAHALVGVQVVSGVDFSGVPRGTRGKIVATYQNGTGQWFLDVAWTGIPGGSPHERQHGGRRVDGFSRREVLMFLDLEGRAELAHVLAQRGFHSVARDVARGLIPLDIARHVAGVARVTRQEGA